MGSFFYPISFAMTLFLSILSVDESLSSTTMLEQDLFYSAYIWSMFSNIDKTHTPEDEKLLAFLSAIAASVLQLWLVAPLPDESPSALSAGGWWKVSVLTGLKLFFFMSIFYEFFWFSLSHKCFPLKPKTQFCRSRRQKKSEQAHLGATQTQIWCPIMPPSLWACNGPFYAS